jgi:hypothetical protein
MRAICHEMMLPSLSQNKIGTSELDPFRSSILGPWSPSRPGDSHPEPLTDPDLTLSRHPARATTGRLPPSVERWSSSRRQMASVGPLRLRWPTPFAPRALHPLHHCRVGGGALDCSCAGLRPPHKLDVQFSRIQLS